MSIIVLKIGGSVITKKEKGIEADLKAIKRIAREIKESFSKNPNLKLVLVHGGGSFGHRIANKYKVHLGLKSGNQLLGFTKTVQVMRELNMIFVDAFQKVGLPIIPLQPSAISIQENGKLSDVFIKTLMLAMDLNCIPVLWGDAVFDKKQGYSILSGDHIMTFLAQKLKSKHVIFGTNVDGVFDSDPYTNKNAKLIRLITPDNIEQILRNVSGSKTTDVTGGMHRKVLEVLPLVKKGIEIEIINAKKQGYILQSLLGNKELGTLISSQ
ncbi:MAG: isopentenyl phosphate kinase [Candidatus Jordarchaeum sp.]|uniref:isopentenyl phosphate kinase n=1 Tax=Candidatus Jordarchaeum sp. TaxID=2823881 RepID=UPI00404A6A07